ncbi:MAG: hypothetical protein RPT11_10860 [Bermanella sp.]
MGGTPIHIEFIRAGYRQPSGATMLSNSNNQPCPQPVSNLAPVANILPANTPMPLACDACDLEQDYSMRHLRSLPELVCQHCGDRRRFSGLELTTLESALNHMGYYLSKSV